MGFREDTFDVVVPMGHYLGLFAGGKSRPRQRIGIAGLLDSASDSGMVRLK